MLAQDCLQDNGDKKADIVVFPMLFSANHAIELYLKSKRVFEYVAEHERVILWRSRYQACLLYTSLAQCFMAIAGFVRKMSGTSEVDTDTMNRAVSKMVEEALKYNQDVYKRQIKRLYIKRKKHLTSVKTV